MLFCAIYRTFPKPLSHLSFVIAATSIGQLLVWSVPWIAMDTDSEGTEVRGRMPFLKKSVTDNGVPSPVLIGIGPKLPHKEQCPVVGTASY